MADLLRSPSPGQRPACATSARLAGARSSRPGCTLPAMAHVTPASLPPVRLHGDRRAADLDGHRVAGRSSAWTDTPAVHRPAGELLAEIDLITMATEAEGHRPSTGRSVQVIRPGQGSRLMTFAPGCPAQPAHPGSGAPRHGVLPPRPRNAHRPPLTGKAEQTSSQMRMFVRARPVVPVASALAHSGSPLLGPRPWRSAGDCSTFGVTYRLQLWRSMMCWPGIMMP